MISEIMLENKQKQCKGNVLLKISKDKNTQDSKWRENRRESKKDNVWTQKCVS